MNPPTIEEYASGGPVLAKAIEGLTRKELLATPVAGTWSIQQIVLHLMDSDLIASDRMKRVIAEDNPALIGYNETLFSQKLFYERLDPFVAADIFAKNRQQTAIILRSLPDTAFERFGTHNEGGRMTLGQLVEIYVEHLAHHLKFLYHKRSLLGR
jgi:hypothetical protein